MLFYIYILTIFVFNDNDDCSCNLTNSSNLPYFFLICYNKFFGNTMSVQDTTICSPCRPKCLDSPAIFKNGGTHTCNRAVIVLHNKWVPSIFGALDPLGYNEGCLRFKGGLAGCYFMISLLFYII